MDEPKELYIEPTSSCNLNCVMCSRNHWESETRGHMDVPLFDKVIDEIPGSINRIFFGGMGEPLCHPDIEYMLRRAKGTGRTVELITNGTLLNNEMSGLIIDLGIDTLWLSLDSLEKDCYEKIRSGADYSGVIDNIQIFNEKRFQKKHFLDSRGKSSIHDWYEPQEHSARVKLGIVFVLMKSNLTQFKELLIKSHHLGIAKIITTHLIPYYKSQLNQICYDRIFGLNMYGDDDRTTVLVDMPFIDVKDVQDFDLLPLVSTPMLAFSIMGTPLRTKANYCRFVQEGLVFLRWDGEVCPCMALLHENKVYQFQERHIKPCSYGNINDLSLLEIWKSETYTAFRQRVINFAFSPCTKCDPCHSFEKNEEDCFGNTFPTCGACLWAQGLIQCP